MAASVVLKGRFQFQLTACSTGPHSLGSVSLFVKWTVVSNVVKISWHLALSMSVNVSNDLARALGRLRDHFLMCQSPALSLSQLLLLESWSWN